MEPLKLWCWVYGQGAEEIFQVKVSGKENVVVLREVIKKEIDVDADNLALYKGPFDDDEHLKDKLIQWKLSGNQSLGPQQTLSKLFPKSDKQKWLIIINPLSNMTLNCLVHGNDIYYPFLVKIPGKETVAFLEKAIQNENVGFRYVDFALYKVSLSCNENFRESLKGLALDRAQLLHPSQTLTDIFPNLPLQDHLHIITISSESHC
ncbi:hypothetical protein J3A83DRAFT_4096277 [Scleroderma citrinum]